MPEIENDKDSCVNCRFWDKNAHEAIEENEEEEEEDLEEDNSEEDEGEEGEEEEIEEEEKGVCTIQSDGSSDLAYVSEIGDAVLLTRGDFFCNLYKVKQ
jgi:hypothetical protein